MTQATLTSRLASSFSGLEVATEARPRHLNRPTYIPRHIKPPALLALSGLSGEDLRNSLHLAALRRPRLAPAIIGRADSLTLTRHHSPPIHMRVGSLSAAPLRLRNGSLARRRSRKSVSSRTPMLAGDSPVAACLQLLLDINTPRVLHLTLLPKAQSRLIDGS